MKPIWCLPNRLESRAEPRDTRSARFDEYDYPAVRRNQLPQGRPSRLHLSLIHELGKTALVERACDLRRSRVVLDDAKQHFIGMTYEKIPNLAQQRHERIRAQLAEPMTEIESGIAFIHSDQPVADTQRRVISFFTDRLDHLVGAGFRAHVCFDPAAARKTAVNIKEQRADSVRELLRNTGFVMREHPARDALIRHGVVRSRECYSVDTPVAKL